MTEPRRSIRQNHLALGQQILTIAMERGLRPGDHLPEQTFSEACGVSRTPIRSALKLLEQNEILTWREEEGYFLAIGSAEELADAVQKLEKLENSLAQRILADRAERRIGDVQSVRALMERYSASRSSVLIALKVLSRDGIVTQMPGQAWVFQPILDSPKSIDESLSFRLTLEPQAILAPGFGVDLKRAGLLRTQMTDLMESRSGTISAARFHRIDTDFHSFIAECSGNRFVRGALLAHHRLRRSTQKDTSIPDFRLRQSLQEHLDILDSVESAQYDLAADQMILHLRRSRIRRPEAANRGTPPLMRAPRS